MPTEKISNVGEINILDFLSRLTIVKSKSEARRLIEQGGIIIDNQKKTNINENINLTKQQELIVKKGKKTFIKVIVE